MGWSAGRVSASRAGQLAQKGDFARNKPVSYGDNRLNLQLLLRQKGTCESSPLQQICVTLCRANHRRFVDFGVQL